jgi:hypothetical protein
MKKPIINKREPVFKQIEKLYSFDKKESAFFKAPRKNVEKKITQYRGKRITINSNYGERKGFEIHTHYYKTRIIPSILDVVKPFGAKRGFSDMVVVVSDKAVMGGIVYKIDSKKIKEKINLLTKKDNIFIKLYKKINPKELYFTDFLKIKKYMEQKAIHEIKQEARKRKLTKQLNNYVNESDKVKQIILSLEYNIFLKIYSEFGINLKFIPNNGFYFDKKLCTFKEKK